MIDMQYDTPPTTTVDPTVKTNRRMCNKRRFIPYLFLPLMSGFGEHFFVLMPTNLLSSLFDYVTHELLQYLADAVGNQSTITLV